MRSTLAFCVVTVLVIVFSPGHAEEIEIPVPRHSSTDIPGLGLSVLAGIREMKFTFLEEKTTIPTIGINFSMIFKQGYFLLFSVDDSSDQSTDKEGAVGNDVDGNVSRHDKSAAFGMVLRNRDVTAFPTVNLLIGYTDGETDLEYDDGVDVSFLERGLYLQLTSTAYKNSDWTIAASLGYARLGQSRISINSTPIDKVSETGVVEGWRGAFNVSYGGLSDALTVTAGV